MQNYASWSRRCVAMMIDGVLSAVPVWIGAGVAMPLLTTRTASAAAPWIAYVSGTLIGLGVQVYTRVYLAGRTGQSPGRRLMRIRLVGEVTGRPIGAGAAFLRELAHTVDSLSAYVGWFLPLWDSKQQTIADKIMKTVVVTVEDAQPAYGPAGSSRYGGMTPPAPLDVLAKRIVAVVAVLSVLGLCCGSCAMVLLAARTGPATSEGDVFDEGSRHVAPTPHGSVGTAASATPSTGAIGDVRSPGVLVPGR